MDDPTHSFGIPRRQVWARVSLILLLIGVIVLALAMIRLNRPAKQTGTPADIALTAQVNNAKPNELASDGKMVPAPTPDELSGFPVVPTSIEQEAVAQQAFQAFERLFAVIPPVHDYFFAAEELGRVDFGDRTVRPTSYRVGDRATFNTNDGSRQAELVLVDELAVYWVEVGLTLDRDELAEAAERLRVRYYPLLTRNMGQEWRPGVDGDPRFTVLHIMESPETYELGYFTDENQYSRALFSKSNEREMVYLNMALLEPGPLYDGTLIHEVQHLVQWNLDANEDKWLNEGLSQIAEKMAGLDTVDPRPYLEQPTIRLDHWPDPTPAIHAHYAGSYLYLLYLWEQLGDAALTELARHPANGLSAVRAVLSGHQPALSLESFTADWAAALYLDGESDDPRFSIAGHDLDKPFLANRVRQLPFEVVSTLDQYAVDYIDLDFSGPATIRFAGDSAVELIDSPPEGETFWYALSANSSRSQLTAAVDLSNLSSATLSFAAWYDLEPDYDFTYLSVSTDRGATWRLLAPDHSTTGAYGPAWGGLSRDAADQQNGWLWETIDLDRYAGQALLLRFDVVTDFEKFGRGFALSNLTIPQLAEQPEWLPDGFVETGNRLPQKWAVRLIREGKPAEVLPLTLDALNRVQATVELGPEGGVLVIMPLTPFVESTAGYWLSISR